MKKALLILMLLTSGSLAMAQVHRCGTTEYYQLRMQQDPTLEQRMQQEELFIQQWVKEHPVTIPTKQEKAQLPSLPGFQPSGDLAIDREVYKAAKEAYVSQHPVQKSTTNLTVEELETAHRQHKVTITHISNQSK